MNLASGIFTAPTSGRYFFSFNALSEIGGSRVYFRLNGETVTTAWGQINDQEMPLSATLNLKKGDRIDTWLSGGSLYDSHSFYSSFSGILLEQDLDL